MMILGTALTGLFSVGTNSGSTGSDAGFTGQTRQSGWHHYERSAIGDLLHGPLPDCWRISAAGAPSLGCFDVNGTDGAGIMAWSAPQMKSETHLNYPQLLGSVFSMFISNKILRNRALLGFLTFANFSILWTSMAFCLPLHLLTTAMV